MHSREEAVADLLARGLHAQPWDSPATPGAFAVASEAIDIGDGIRLLKHMVLVLPAEGGWSIQWQFPVGIEGVSLAEAVDAASILVSELREYGRPRRFLVEKGGD